MCHHFAKTVTFRWKEIGLDVQEPPRFKPAMNWELQEHQNYFPKWSKFYIEMD